MLKYIFPIWLSMAINSLLGITDFYFLRHLGDQAYYIIGAGTIPFLLVTQLLTGFGIETNRWVSKNNYFDLKKTFFLLLIFSVILALITYIISGYLVFYIKDIESKIKATLYLQSIAPSIIPITGLFVLTGASRGASKPKFALFFTVLIIILNAIFDYLFVKIMANPIVAVGRATVLSDIIGVSLYYLWASKCLDVQSFKNDMVFSFIVRSLKQGVEKIISSGFLSIGLSATIALLPITFSGFYFALERYLLPLFLFGYALFEWRLHQKSADKPREKLAVYGFVCVASITYTFFILFFIKSQDNWIYGLLYLATIFLFWNERLSVAHLFSIQHENAAIKVVAYYKVITVLGLFLCNLLGLLTQNIFFAIYICLLIVQDVHLQRVTDMLDKRYKKTSVSCN